MSRSVNREHLAIRPIVAGLMLSTFLVALDSTIVSTAMPTIAGELGGFSLYAWVPAVYLLTTAVTTPLYGKLADLYGRKPILFLGIGLFLLGSVTSGAAPSMLLLVVFRAIQGMGAGAVLPITTTIVGDLFSLEQRARIQGVFGSVWGAASVIGPLMGGFLTDSVGWRWIFYLNVPVGLLAVLLIWSFFGEQRVERRHALDLAGACLLTVAISSALLLLIEGGQSWAWLSAPTFILFAATVLCLIAFIRQERKAAEPVLPLDLFRIRIVSVSSLGMFFAGVVMVTISFVVPLYTQGVLGQDALHAGFALAPMSIGWPLASTFSGRLAIRFGYRATAVAGLLINAVGVALLLTLNQRSVWETAAAFSFLIGIGLGLSATPMLVGVQSSVGWARRGVATATTMFVRSFGGVAGLAVLGAIINSAMGRYGGASATNQSLNLTKRHALPASVLAQIHHALFTGIHAAFIASLSAAVIALVVATRLPGGSARDHEVREEVAESAEPWTEVAEPTGSD